HGTFYMLGAFLGYTTVRVAGSFWLALIVSPVLAGAVGAAFELGLLRRLYRRDASAFLMVTFGLTLVLEELIRLTWGVQALQVDVNLVRSGIFGIGCGLAALGGVLAAPLVTASLGMAANAVIDAFVIVIIGGMGTFLGSLIAAVLVAFVQVFGNYFFPDF